MSTGTNLSKRRRNMPGGLIGWHDYRGLIFCVYVARIQRKCTDYNFIRIICNRTSCGPYHGTESGFDVRSPDWMDSARTPPSVPTPGVDDENVSVRGHWVEADRSWCWVPLGPNESAVSSI
jgi:hypothetical protein